MQIDIESIERATLAAVPPTVVAELPGWLLGLDEGTVGRSHSAVPLRHGAPGVEVIDTVEKRYAAQGLGAVWRLPMLAEFDALRKALTARGYIAHQPTCTQTGTVTGMLALPANHGTQVQMKVQINQQPTDAWSAVFLGEGFDAVDGAHRIRLLGRALDAVYASAQIDERTVAVGTASFSHGWASVHGMRTAQTHRGRGLASSILQALAREAQRRQIERVFLQVEAANDKAQALYRRAGFATAWVYEYWRRVGR